MELRRGGCVLLALFLSIFSSSCGRTSSDVSASRSVDYLIRDRAFRELVRRRTGVVYRVPLPANLSAMEALVLRMRSGSLWRRGANLSASHIPPGTLAVPHVKRVVVVDQNWRGMSASYFGVPGYELAAPVIGVFLYDASDNASSAELDLRVTGDPVSIRFPVAAPDSSMRCARFERDGSVHLQTPASAGQCTARSTGHFAIIVPSGSSSGHAPARKEKKWRVLAMEIVGGMFALAVVVLMGMGIRRLAKKKRTMKQIVRHAEENDALGAACVGKSRMPSATMTRTQPRMEENEVAPMT
ncbi:hypothetical protein OPV22_018407 [Ensete ventricosum]|uniref:Uncharacterized protein n=1 Tax=Ensete ventricosum TaxID=4639 RepID=A0AAV8R379_ENSVE|nr:hypothetical protein OPV22_018407 [Ensete ventricosum]RZS15405.1 hypothetical protein BHM03_00047242 [Ensete ventricosum]